MPPVTVSGLARGNRDDCIDADVGHSTRLAGTVVVAVLQDAEAINPQGDNSESPGEDHGVMEGFGKRSN